MLTPQLSGQSMQSSTIFLTTQACYLPNIMHFSPFLQRDIYNNSRLLVELCVIKLDQDWFVLLDLLAIVLNPTAK